MHEAYWGLAESPFRKTFDPGFFFAGAAQREALARLLFAVEQGIPLAILRGRSGAGKTAVLRHARSRMPARAGTTRCISVCGADEQESLWRLAAEIGASPRSHEPPFLLRQRVADCLRASRLLGQPTTILLDDADRTPAEVIQSLTYLVRASDTRATVVLALDADRPWELESELRNWSPLQIPLDPWEADEINDYLARSLERAGGAKGIFDESAVRRLSQLSGGLPRWVSRLADLCLVAGAAEERTSIDGAMVEGVFAELQGESPADYREAA